MCHHDIPNSRYNVFLPLFDLLFGSTGREKAKCLSNLQETRPVRTVDAPSRVGSTGRGSRSALLPESGDMPICEFRKF
jgi:hypothetical protein